MGGNERLWRHQVSAGCSACLDLSGIDLCFDRGNRSGCEGWLVGHVTGTRETCVVACTVLDFPRWDAERSLGLGKIRPGCRASSSNVPDPSSQTNSCTAYESITPPSALAASCSAPPSSEVMVTPSGDSKWSTSIVPLSHTTPSSTATPEAENSVGTGCERLVTRVDDRDLDGHRVVSRAPDKHHQRHHSQADNSAHNAPLRREPVSIIGESVARGNGSEVTFHTRPYRHLCAPFEPNALPDMGGCGYSVPLTFTAMWPRRLPTDPSSISTATVVSMRTNQVRRGEP